MWTTSSYVEQARKFKFEIILQCMYKNTSSKLHYSVYTKTKLRQDETNYIIISLFLIIALICNAIATPKYDGKVRKEKDGSESSYMIPPYMQSHASTLEILPDGSLASAWFSGEREEASGCAIVFSTLRNGAWSSAKTLSKRMGYSNQNPVLFYDDIQDTLHLFHSQAKAESGVKLLFGI